MSLKTIVFQDAVIREIEIIGEATKNLSMEFRNKHPSILWRQIAGMRDKLNTWIYKNLELLLSECLLLSHSDNKRASGSVFSTPPKSCFAGLQICSLSEIAGGLNMKTFLIV